MTVDVTGRVPEPDQVPFASARGRPAGPRLHGPDPGDADDRDPGRRRLHRLVHQRADRGPAGRGGGLPGPEGGRRASGPWSSRAREQVRHQAEAEGLDAVFREAGAEWRESGCSMCLAMNPDKLTPRQRSASTSNRNFEGRQGPGGRTHLVSPAMAAAAAVARALHRRPPDAGPGELTDPMEPFMTHRGKVAVLDWTDVNTDLIIPARYLKRVERTGYGPLLFADKRYVPGGAPEADDPEKHGAERPRLPPQPAPRPRGRPCWSSARTSAAARAASTPSGPSPRPGSAP